MTTEISKIELNKAREVLEEIKSKHQPTKVFHLSFSSMYKMVETPNYNLTKKLFENIQNIKKKYVQ